MKKVLGIIAMAIMVSVGRVYADEGMWLPMFVERLNYVDMQKMGLQLTPEELYSINHSSLKDAIVGLGSSAPTNTTTSATASGPRTTARNCPLPK